MIATVTPARPRSATPLRRFAAALAAGATALSLLAASAVPARADADDAAKILAGIAALAIIGKVLEDNDKPKATPAYHPWPRRGHPEPVWPRPDRPDFDRPDHEWPREGRPEQGRPDHERPREGRPEQGRADHDRPHYDRPVYRRPGHENLWHDRPRHGDDDDFPGRRPPRDDVRGPRLPGVCAFTFDAGRHDTTVYSGRCLEREGFHARLPRYCAQDVRVRGRHERVYEQRCLIEAGFRAGRR